MTNRMFALDSSSALLLLSIARGYRRRKAAWRQATDAELASLLPARAPVEKEHIETEMRTASGIVNGHGHFIAGVVLLTAGYSADGKYSHYLMVQAPVRIGGVCSEAGRVCVRVGSRQIGRRTDGALSHRGHGHAGGHRGGASDRGAEPRGESPHLAAGGEAGHADRAFCAAL